MRFILYTLILLTFTPTFSVTSIVGLPYSPNHFWTLGVITLYVIAKLNQVSIVTFILMFSWIIANLNVWLLRFGTGLAQDLYPADIVTVIIYTQLFYLINNIALYAKYDYIEIVRSVLLIHSVIAIFQTLALNSPFVDAAYVFITHPDQVNGYYFPQWLGPLHRVPGLFLEASQLSGALAIFLYFVAMKNLITWRDTLLFLVFVINGSTTGFLILFVGIIFYFIKKLLPILLSLKVKWTHIYISAIILTMCYFISELSTIIDKLKILLQFWQTGSVVSNLNSIRLIAFIDEYNDIGSATELFVGRGLQYVWGWDIFSVSIRGLGLVIFAQFILFVLYHIREKLEFLVIFFTLGISTGSILEPVYILLILMYCLSNRGIHENET